MSQLLQHGLHRLPQELYRTEEHGNDCHSHAVRSIYDWSAIQGYSVSMRKSPQEGYETCSQRIFFTPQCLANSQTGRQKEQH